MYAKRLQFNENDSIVLDNAEEHPMAGQAELRAKANEVESNATFGFRGLFQFAPWGAPVLATLLRAQILGCEFCSMEWRGRRRVRHARGSTLSLANSERFTDTNPVIYVNSTIPTPMVRSRTNDAQPRPDSRVID